MMISTRSIQQWLLYVGGALIGIAQTTSLTSAAEFVSPHGRFRVDMGAEPVQVIRSRGKNPLQFQLSVTTTDGTYLVTHSDFPHSFDNSETFEKHLTGVRGNFVKLFGARDIEDKSVTQTGEVGHEFQFVAKRMGGNVRWRTFLVGKREYNLVAIGGRDFVHGPDTSAFLDSFTLLPETKAAVPTGFLPLIGDTANFQAIMLPTVESLAGRISANSDKHLYALTARNRKGHYGIIYQEVSGLESQDHRDAAEITIKENAVTMMTRGSDAKFTQKSWRKLKQSGVEGYEFDFQEKNGIDQYRLRVFASGEHAYAVIVGAPVKSFESARPDEFLDAFRFLDFQAAKKESSPNPPPGEKQSEPKELPVKESGDAEKAPREKAIQQLKDF